MNDDSTTPATGTGGLKQKALAGAAWVSGGQVAQIIVRLGVLMILARLLTPAEFGLVAFALVILGFCQTVASLGTAAALVRLHEAGPPEIKAAFTISMIMATLLAAVAIAVAYAMQDQLDVPGLGLATLILVPAVHFDAVNKIASRMLQSTMRFRPVTVSALIGYLSGYGGVGVTLAYLGFGWRALCGAEITSIVVSAAYLVWAGRPPLGLSFDIPVWRKLIRFGAPLTVSNLLYWGANSLPRLMLGAFASATALGLYSRAADLSARFGSLADRLCGTVVFAAFCQRIDDKPKLAKTLAASSSLIFVLVLPLAAILSALAEPVVLLFFGDQWIAAVGAFRILAFVIPLLLLQRIALTMGLSLGRPGLAIRAHLLTLVISVGGSILGVHYGPEGVALAVLLAMGASSLLAYIMVSREVALPFSASGASMAKGSALMIVVFAVCVAVQHILIALLGPLSVLGQLGIMGAVVGGLLMLSWIVGKTWLLSKPALDLLLNARQMLGQRLGKTSVQILSEGDSAARPATCD